MRAIAIDTESTTKNKGNPYTLSNKLVCVATYSEEHGKEFYKVEYDETPYGMALQRLQCRLDSHDCLVLFNAKHDLAWLSRYGISFNHRPFVWDCQLVSFLFDRQRNVYPSLDSVLSSGGLALKLDKVKEYWEKGFDTPEIPLDILEEYNCDDAHKTWQVYEKQREYLKENPRFRPLIYLMGEDIWNLLEIERNGIRYDFERAAVKNEEVTSELLDIDDELASLSGYRFLNFNSDDHVSALLFGGVVGEKYQEEYVFNYKDTTKAPAIKTRWRERLHQLPALTSPLPGTETLKERKSVVYQVNEGVLRKLKGDKKTKKIIELLLRRTKLEKLKSTYLDGFVKLHEKMDFKEGIFNSQMTQCGTGTGRLASKNPNKQNLDDRILDCIVSRF